MPLGWKSEEQAVISFVLKVHVECHGSTEREMMVSQEVRRGESEFYRMRRVARGEDELEGGLVRRERGSPGGACGVQHSWALGVRQGRDEGGEAVRGDLRAQVRAEESGNHCEI